VIDWLRAGKRITLRFSINKIKNKWLLKLIRFASVQKNSASEVLYAKNARFMQSVEQKEN